MDGNYYLAANKPSPPPDLTRYILLILALLGFVGMPSAHPAGNHALQSFALSYQPMNFGRPARTVVTVEDKETHDPLLGATVSIVSRADTLRGTTVKEDFYRIMAVYRCDRIFRDSVDLEVTYVGYKPFKKRYGNTGFRGRIEVKMEVDEQSIAQVVVVGQQVAMVFRGDTTVYNAGAFKTMADDRFAELLKQLPGVEIKDNKIYAEGQEVKRVLIDGKNLFGSKTSYALTDLEASDVRSVRVYEDFSPEAKRLGDNTAEKEKVMDVETKSKRGYILGGNLEGTLGASLERDYSGRHEIRHSEAGSFYRNTERGNWRLEASNSKDNIRQGEGVSFDSKTTPTKQTDAQADYTLRRGDSTNVSTAVRFGRSRQSSTGSSQTEYFPTEAYALRSEESRTESLSKSLSAEISNYVNIQRKKKVFGAMTTFSIDDGSTLGHSRTQQRIDDEKTRTNLNSNSDRRNIRLNVSIFFHSKISERSTLSFNVSGKYAPGDRDGWRVDTTASTPGLQVKLRNDGDSRNYSFGANLGYRYKLGKKGSVNASYNFSRDYARSKQLAVDFLSDPQGVVDTVNSYHYTTDTYTHSLQTSLQYRSGDVWIMAGLGGVLYDIARSERFPKEERFPRLFFQLNPTVYLSVGKSRKRFSFNLASFPQMIPLDALRSTLNATNPLSLQAGNPGLKLQNDLSGSAGFQFTDVKKALSFSVRLNGSYTFNYIAQRRTLFLPAPVRLHGTEGCAAHHAGQRRGQLQPRGQGLLLTADQPAALDPERLGELRLQPDALFHRRRPLPLGPPFARLRLRLRLGLFEQGQAQHPLQHLDEFLHHAERDRAGAARTTHGARRPALRQVFRVGRHALRILLQQPLARAHAPQRDPQRLGGAQVRQGEPAGAFGGRHRHPQPPRLRHHEFRHGLHRHLLNLLPGPLRLPARRLYVLIGSRRNYGVISVYFV